MVLELSCYNYGFITKENFHKFHGKNQKKPPEVFQKKKCILKNFAKFTGKDLCQSLFFHKTAGLRSSKKFLRTPFLQNSTGRLLLENNYQASKNLFQTILIYEFLFIKTRESFIASLFFVSAEKKYRSSCSEVFFLKDILKNFAKFP